MTTTAPRAATATFRATILPGGKTATGIEVPPDVVAARFLAGLSSSSRRRA